jgi:hypothetical protein
VAADVEAVEDAFLAGAEAIEGLNFALEHDPEARLPANPPGVTMSLIGVLPRQVDIGPVPDWDCAWVIRLYLPFETSAAAHDDLVTYMPAVAEVVHDLRLLPNVTDPVPFLDLGDEPDRDLVEGRRKLTKTLTLNATLLDTP